MLNDEEQLYDIYYKEKYIDVASEKIYQIIEELKQELHHTHKTNEILKEKLKAYQNIGKEYNIFSSEDLEEYIHKLKKENDNHKLALVDIINDTRGIQCNCSPCVVEEEVKKVLFKEK